MRHLDDFVLLPVEVSTGPASGPASAPLRLLHFGSFKLHFAWSTAWSTWRAQVEHLILICSSGGSSDPRWSSGGPHLVLPGPICSCRWSCRWSHLLLRWSSGGLPSVLLAWPNNQQMSGSKLPSYLLVFISYHQSSHYRIFSISFFYNTIKIIC